MTNNSELGTLNSKLSRLLGVDCTHGIHPVNDAPAGRSTWLAKRSTGPAGAAMFLAEGVG